MDTLVNGDLVGKAAVNRRVCPIFFLLDCSGSMGGLPIGAVNDAVEGVLSKMIRMNSSNADTKIEVAILKFGADEKYNEVAEWVTGDSGLVDVSSFNWTYLDAYGMTPMGEAFDKLNAALSVKHGFMRRASGSVAPVLFLLTDGYATDDAKASLERLKNNSWYKIAIKVAIGYGRDYDKALLVDFTGNEKSVVETDDPNVLTSMIEFVTITSSMVASQGSSSLRTGEVGKNMSSNDKVAEELAGLINPKGSNGWGVPAVNISDAYDPDEKW